MNVNRKIDILGRVVIPAEFRNALGLHDGDTVNISCKDGAITITAEQKTCKLCGSQEDVSSDGLCKACIDMIVSKYSAK